VLFVGQRQVLVVVDILTMASVEAIPTTCVPADGPYHESYPQGVKVSRFISSRAIEPFYDVLEILATTARARELDFTITAYEMDQDLGQFSGHKGFEGCTGEPGVTGPIGEPGIIGAIGEPTRDPPPVQDRHRYGLEEIRITIEWKKSVDTKLEGKVLPVVSPLIKTLSYQRGVDGILGCVKRNVRRKMKVAYMAVPKPLFYEVLKAYQTIYPDWTANDLFESKRSDSANILEDCPWYDEDAGIDDAYIIQRLDHHLFGIVTFADITDDTDMSAVSASAGALGYASKIENVTTDQVDYLYKVSLLALDLRANKDTLLNWLME